MSRDILDLIDSTLDDVAVSDDAMRWAPDAPEPTSASWAIIDETHIRAAEIRRAWFYEAMTAALRPVMSSLERALAEFVAATGPAALERAARQRARISRMHSEYHRRTRRSVHR